MVQRAAWLLPRSVSDGQTRDDTRLALSGGMTPTAALTARSGVIPGGSPCDLVAVSAMQCKITTGRLYIQGTTTQGAYPAYVDADVTLTVPDGDATYGRIDLVVARIYDHVVDASGQTKAIVERITGTPAPVPTVPATPTASLALWEITVPAGRSSGNGGIASSPGWSSARTDRRQFTVASGGIVPAGGASWSGAYTGQVRDDGTGLVRWNGTAWVSPDRLVPWTNFPLAAGITTGETGAIAQYRVSDHQGTPYLELSGAMTMPSGLDPLEIYIGTLPAGARPASLRWFVGSKLITGTPGTVYYRALVETSGNVTFTDFGGASAGAWFNMDGVRVRLD